MYKLCKYVALGRIYKSAPTVNKIPFQQPICLATVSNLCYRGLRKKYKYCCYEKDRKTGSH